MPSERPIRVLTGRGYPVDFCIDLGQHGVTFDRHELRPRRWFRSFDPSAICGWTGRGYDLIHTWNAVPLWPLKPFLVTFEATFPRVWADKPAQRRTRRWLVGRLMSKRCAGLLAISEYARGKFRASNAGLTELPALEAKTRVLYPAVDVRTAAPKKPGETLTLCFVGRDFMRKGGAAVTRAHRLLKARGVPVQTHVVSGVGWSPGEYASPREGFDIEAEQRLLRQQGLTHHPKLSNDLVVGLVARCDYTLLPTMHDTFGFNVLESLAAGTPVIASATCALPEMLDDTCGRLLPLENNETNEWVGLAKRPEPGFNELFMAEVERLAVALADTLERNWQSRVETYEALSAGAIERVRTRFDRSTQRATLEDLYRTLTRR
jgi:glycosyltransferase involved in cell wall biosynthesis